MTRVRSAIVTGASGFLGSCLVSHFMQAGIEVTCLVRAKQKLPSSIDCGQVRIIETPLFRASELKRQLLGVPGDILIHLASYGVRQEERDPEQLIDGNVGLLHQLLEAIRDRPLHKFIHTGSCSEYGFPVSDAALISETHPLRPASPYGAAKAASVLFGHAIASNWSIPLVTLRLFGVFGTHEAPHRLIPYMIARLNDDQAAELTPGEQVRDLLFEGDVAAAFLEAAKSDRVVPYEVYNVCSAQPVRIRQVGEAVADSLTKPRTLLHWGKRPYRTDEPMWLVGDNRKFVEATPWRPRVSLQEGIRRMISSAKLTAAQR